MAWRDYRIYDTSMKKPVVALLLMLIMLAVGGTAILREASPIAKGPVLSVRAVQSLLKISQGGSASGNVLLVQGVLFGTSGTVSSESSYSVYGLRDPSMEGGTPTHGIATIPVLWIALTPDRLRSFLRQIPLLNALVPEPQRLTSRLGTYRIRLNPGRSCLVGSCPDAYLLDAAS